MPLKILIVSWYFPPFNTMGALRTGKLAKYLAENGHDVRVLCARDLPFSTTLPNQFPEDRIERTKYLDVNGFPRLVQRIRLRFGTTTSLPAGASDDAGMARLPHPSILGGVLRRLRMAYQVVFNFPDAQIGWLPGGLSGGKRLLNEWRPDIIFATAPPFTTLFVARRLARKYKIPWVAEFRDRWSEDPYSEYSHWMFKFVRIVENWLLKNICGLVTVSEPWAHDYRKRFSIPVAAVMNGFDPDEFPTEYDRSGTDSDRIRIIYTGILYPDRRDPSPLFEALGRMGDEAGNIRVEFYGADPATLLSLANKHGVARLVEIHDRVPYDESIKLQMQADILLLMQWNDPKEQGNVPGKLFEYIGSRRPVLALGPANGIPAKILAERGAGVLVNDPDEIRRHLRGWMAKKKELGEIPLVPVEARAGLSRPEQYALLEDFLFKVLCRPSPARNNADIADTQDYKPGSRN